ncbi:MAG TPA: glycosyltransferase [Phycisphaerae bacterium]|nr:glycosyltransferase [Phycisphaerae bacterium]
MKILHVIYGLPVNFGGPTEGLANLARAQAQRGDDVTVLPCRFTSGPQTLPAGRDDRLHVLEPVTHGRLLWYDARVRRRVRELARGCDIVHIHGTWRYHLLAAAAAADEYGIPYVIRPAGNLGVVSRSGKGLRKWLYLRLVERRPFERAAAVHCTSLKEQRELDGLPLRVRRCFIVPQPVSAPPSDTRHDASALGELCPAIEPADQVLLYLGRICAVKNLPIVLEAFLNLQRDFERWHLVLAGYHEDVRLVERLKQRAAQTSAARRVWLPGLVRGAAKTACLARADLFAQASKHENFGLSVAEALQFGVPCVASDGVALAADVQQHGAGLMCPPTVADFTANLRTLMADEAYRHQCAAAARRLAERFAPAAVAEALDREYRACLGEPISGQAATAASGVGGRGI